MSATDNIDYKEVLNPSQLEAVTTLDGPVLVIAGAGSGKTRTLIYRVARLVESGIPPESILLLTFTRKAALEMLERAAGLSDPRCRFVSGGTFHSLAHRVLRQHAALLGFETSFTILDRSDMEEAIQTLLPDLQINKGAGKFPKRGTLANILSKASNVQQPIEIFMAEEYGQFLHVLPTVERLAELYSEYKKNHQMMDYDDLIIYLRKLLAEHEDVRNDLGRQYSHIMVDEYQDTNSIQADIVKWLAHQHKNVMVVGDDSQAIYSFRGADFTNMFDFPNYFPGTKQIKLEENYRSTQPILTLTNSIMSLAREKYTKCLFTRREGGESPKLIDTRTEPEQAMFICQKVNEMMQQGRSIKDFAVLFRAGYHSFELEVELARQDISFVKYGGFKFLESAHIKDFLAHLRVLVNGNDAISWNRILRLIVNIGQAKSNAIIEWIRKHSIQPGQIGKWPGGGRKTSGLKSLSKLLTTLDSKKLSPEKAVEHVMEYYNPILENKFDDYPKRQKELERLMPMASRYKKLRNFLDDLALDPPSSSSDIDPRERIDTLTLSTVHSAKGLEWPVVFIIWLMEGRFPPARSYNNPDSIEEERRLLYVATTRAKDQLFMCYPGNETLPHWQLGGAGIRNGLSSFIQALPSDVVSHESMTSIGGFRRPERFVSNFHDSKDDDEETSPFFPGERVNHPAFGPGVVSKLMGDDKVEVLFRNYGRKLLHMGYTSLEKI